MTTEILDAVQDRPGRWRVLTAPLDTYASAARLFAGIAVVIAMLGVGAWALGEGGAWLWLAAAGCLGAVGLAVALLIVDVRVSAGQGGA